METAPIELGPAANAREELARLSRKRRSLLVQAPGLLASAAVLVLGAGALAENPLDLQFLFLAATGLFSLAAIHFVDEVCELLSCECPRCAKAFFGEAPDHAPSPFRRRCAHCGVGFADAAPHTRGGDVESVG